ncbi:hypothetical protein RMSM_03595 [Rhodopirellula maiorica SM1]|uniref:Uncharacterized protein n=1 Tax=Rhodopirellula maiorica SM1 TaxID=1265738 RepID=M5RZY0_9BACT|nr:hypothetical protein RMSM_03595 [Rhodopirellula maiorica SM1]
MALLRVRNLNLLSVGRNKAVSGRTRTPGRTNGSHSLVTQSLSKRIMPSYLISRTQPHSGRFGSKVRCGLIQSNR